MACSLLLHNGWKGGLLDGTISKDEEISDARYAGSNHGFRRGLPLGQS